jgi:hypothetical protein
LEKLDLAFNKKITKIVELKHLKFLKELKVDPNPIHLLKKNEKISLKKLLPNCEINNY